MCHMSCVMCHVSPVTFHMSPVTNNSHSHIPPPSNFPTMHSRLVHQDRTQEPFFWVTKKNGNKYVFGSLHVSRFCSPTGGGTQNISMDFATLRPNRPRGGISENKNQRQLVFFIKKNKSSQTIFWP